MVLVSIFGILTVVLLAYSLGFAKAPRIADAAAAQRLAVDAIHDFRPTEAVVASDGRGALVAAGDGRIALVRPFGDRWVVRIVNGAASEIHGGKLRLKPAETMFPPAEIDLGAAAAAWAKRL